MKIIWFILAGIAGGILGGMGMGGGTLLIPALTLFLDVPQHTAQWINLVTFIPMSVVALCIHVKHKLVDKSRLLAVTLPAALAAAGASFAAGKSSPELLSRLFGGFLVIIGAGSLCYSVFEKRIAAKVKKVSEEKEERDKI